MADPGLEAIYDKAGVDSEARDYLLARGVKLVSTLGMIADKNDEFYSRMVDPFLQGHDVAGRTHKNSRDQDLVRAQMLVAWQMARKESLELFGGSTPPPSASTSSVAKLKPPTTLEPGIWSQQITKYNNVTISGINRKFPEKMILGAEAILARMWHEIHTTKLYTPVRLGEILMSRFYSASGEMNRIAVEPKKDRILSLDSGGQLHERETPVWDPKNHMAVLDALDAIRWAWIFVEISQEPHINTWVDFFVKLARARPNKLDNVKRLWDMAGWKVALDMRSGNDFATATKTVMEDAVFQNDIMAAHIQPTRAEQRTPRKSTPARRSRSPPAPRQLCNNFAKGNCRMGDRCRYIHPDPGRQAKGKGKGKRQPKPVGARD